MPYFIYSDETTRVGAEAAFGSNIGLDFSHSPLRTETDWFELKSDKTSRARRAIERRRAHLDPVADATVNLVRRWNETAHIDMRRHRRVSRRAGRTRRARRTTHWQSVSSLSCQYFS